MSSRLNSTIAAATLLLASTTFADDGARRLSRHDQLKIVAQKICPVMGKPLGSMGTPAKVKIGEQELFLCCAGCKSKQVDRKHWATIHENFRKAQGTCPVMGKPLTAKSKYTIVDGQIYYVCCPPCIDKIKADPKRWQGKLDELYAASAGPQTADEIKIAVQKICPVMGKPLGSMGKPLGSMGKPLGSMGKPIKVKIGDEQLFLCCEACKTKQVDRQHWATIHENFRRAQGTCPIMGKPVKANAKYTVVNGNIIYVCCPPCIDKLKANAEKSTADLNKLYLTSLQSGATR